MLDALTDAETQARTPPMTNSEAADHQDEPRTAEEVAVRALALSSAIACAKGASKDEHIRWLQSEGLWNQLSPKERAFLTKPVTERQRVNMTWRLEGLVVLFWSIGKLDDLPTLAKQCDTGPLIKATVFPPNPTLRFVKSARLRPLEEIEDEREKVYQAHWKIRDAELNKRRSPRGLDPGVVIERHHAFNWIVGYMGQSWDDVTTDT
jgi:hypothetical protein